MATCIHVMSAIRPSTVPIVLPMEAASVDELPEGSDWQYEPKWDGFRALAFRDPELLVSQVGAFSLCRQ